MPPPDFQFHQGLSILSMLFRRWTSIVPFNSIKDYPSLRYVNKELLVYSFQFHQGLSNSEFVEIDY